METEIKNLIGLGKNICVIPSPEPEGLTAALALFYTLKELGKNANLIIHDFPSKLNFLLPSLDFISSPKNFVISIPRSVADISQIYYEKTEEDLKIHLAVNGGQLKKEGISFYAKEPKPDVIVILGISDFKKHLESNLDSFGFLLDSPVVNIDNNASNLKFGKINYLKESSLAETVLEIIRYLEAPIGKNCANCLAAGLAIYYDYFKSPKTKPETLETAADLMKKGADYPWVSEQLQKANEREFITASPLHG